MRKSIYVVLILVILCGCAPGRYSTDSPFSFEDIDICITYQKENIPSGDSVIESEVPVLRLNISFSVRNYSEDDYRGVWYEFELNEEVKPFIASGIIHHSITDKKMITGEKKAMQDDNDLLVWGFSHSWSPTLTSTSVLKEYYNLSLVEIKNHLESITVTIHWDGGSQTQVIPLTLQESDMDILTSINE